MMHPPVIAVGAEDTDSGRAALRWAASQAARTGGRLIVCHTCPATSALAVRRPHLPAAMLGVLSPDLDLAVSRARHEVGPDRVQLCVHMGRPGEWLVHAAHGADLLVVGASRRRTGTAAYALRHAAVPVVVVPAVGAPPGPFAGHVVVAADTPSAAVYDFAFAWADMQDKPVAVVHGASAPVDGVWFDETTLETHLLDQPPEMADLSAAAEPWHLRHPQVRWKRVVIGGPANAGLPRVAGGAALLVAPEPVPSQLFEEAGCPVAVIPMASAQPAAQAPDRPAHRAA